jgi:DnaJ domain
MTMGFHSFSLDPRTILGVGPTATAEEIHEAYRAKSKKHHPDMGGDEWAFRMVSRAYEVLKTTSRSVPGMPWERAAAGAPTMNSAAESPWSKNRPSGATEATVEDATETSSRGFGWPLFDFIRSDDGASGDGQTSEEVDASPEDAADEPEPATLKTVDVELIWTRFEKDSPSRPLPLPETDDSTLSVCLVLAWPPEDLVERTSEFSASAETLRVLIDLFEQLRGQPAIIAARSRIEDGRFVGWLSYPDVLAAQDAFLKLRETFLERGLTAKLHTRDERVPYDWRTESHSPVMSKAS